MRSRRFLVWSEYGLALLTLRGRIDPSIQQNQENECDNSCCNGQPEIASRRFVAILDWPAHSDTSLSRSSLFERFFIEEYVTSRIPCECQSVTKKLKTDRHVPSWSPSSYTEYWSLRRIQIDGRRQNPNSSLVSFLELLAVSLSSLSTQDHTYSHKSQFRYHDYGFSDSEFSVQSGGRCVKSLLTWCWRRKMRSLSLSSFADLHVSSFSFTSS